MLKRRTISVKALQDEITALQVENTCLTQEIAVVKASHASAVRQMNEDIESLTEQPIKPSNDAKDSRPTKTDK